jgi:hypothetical protein
MQWDGDGSKPIKLINLDKADFQKRFDVVMEYSRNHFGGERTAGAQWPELDGA